MPARIYRDPIASTELWLREVLNQVIRIVGVQRDPTPEKEFVLLQNQGSLRILLRGHVVMADSTITNAEWREASHVFTDDVLVPPGMYVLLATTTGESRWSKTKDGAMIYYSFMNRDCAVWEANPGPVHLMALQHTYVDRGPALLLR